MFALTFLNPNPRLPSPLFLAKSTPESALSRRSRAFSSSNSYPWRPNLRFNGFKLKSATVPENVEGGDLESGSLVKGLKLGGMFGVWYLLNIYYNIFNKQVPSLLHLIKQSISMQEAVLEPIISLHTSMKLVHSSIQVLRVYPYPATVTAFQLGCGTLMIAIMWLLKLHPRPKFSPSQVNQILIPSNPKNREIHSIVILSSLR